MSESWVMEEDGLVERVYSCLADAMRRSRPQAFEAPVTVAEIYQDLVPYRSIRTSVGFHMNADYEHTLLRLLAGEGGYARLEPSEAREELRAELESPNPNVGLFRKFAACDVWITPSEASAEPASAEAATAEPAAAEPEASEETPAPFPAESIVLDEEWTGQDLPWEGVAVEPEEWDQAEPELLLEEEVEATEPVEEAVPISAEPPAPSLTGAPDMLESKSAHAQPGHAGETCAFCSGNLPAGRAVRFCPFCGVDQALHPCPSCSEPLQQDWKFCIACGSAQG